MSGNLIQKLFPREPGEVSMTQQAAPRAPLPAVEDDSELIAVITAAIASMTGQSADGFVVRKINRAAGFVPIWGKAGQMERMDSRRM